MSKFLSKDALPRQKKALLFLLVPLALLPPWSMDIYISSVPGMKVALEATALQVQGTLSFYMIGMALGQLFMGPLVDAFGRRRIGLITLGGYTAASAGCALSTDIHGLMVMRFLQALFICGGGSIMVWAMIRDIISDEARGKVFSYINGVVGLGPTLAPLCGGYLVLVFHSWRASFWCLTLYGAFMLALLGMTLPETLTQEHRLSLDWKGLGQRYRQLLRHPIFMRYAACSGIGMAALFAYFSVSPLLLIERLGVLPQWYGLYFGLNALGFMLGCFVASQIQIPGDPAPTLRKGLLCVLTGGLCLGLLEMRYGVSLWGIVLPNLIVAMGVGFIFGPAMAGALAPFGSMAGTASALLGVIQFVIASGVGAWVAGQATNSILPYALSLLVLAGLGLWAMQGVSNGGLGPP